jgi:hypothetical protein
VSAVEPDVGLIVSVTPLHTLDEEFVQDNVKLVGMMQSKHVLVDSHPQQLPGCIASAEASGPRMSRSHQVER